MSAIPSPAAIWDIATTPMGDPLKKRRVPRKSIMVYRRGPPKASEFEPDLKDIRIASRISYSNEKSLSEVSLETSKEIVSP